jgi:hypothetical protein
MTKAAEDHNMVDHAFLKLHKHNYQNIT